MQPGQDQWHILDYLPKITCPVLAIRGVHDVYGSRLSLTRVEELVTAPLTVLEPDCGHDPHHELREEMLAAMAGFIDGLL
jgi:pimeloyl-ACP methyl ester carboxylesterase